MCVVYLLLPPLLCELGRRFHEKTLKRCACDAPLATGEKTVWVWVWVWRSCVIKWFQSVQPRRESFFLQHDT